jgi:pyruvate/2-oxoglutarate/acetoin dehydrogenase E1 component
MQTLKLSFANINCLNSHMAEVIVDQDVVISLEMSEEYDKALATQFKSDFVLLINKINHYRFAYEAKLTMASHSNLKAIAVITYSKKDRQSVEATAVMRKRDGWNLKVFDGLNLGRQAGIDWLESQFTPT